MTALDFLEWAAALGLHLVQIADNMPLDRMPPEELEAVEGRSRDLGISIEVGTRGIGHDHLRRYLGFASRFKSPVLRIVVDTTDHHPSADEVVTTLSSIMPEFEQAGVVLAVENHDRFSARTLAGIVEGVSSTHLGVCLDTVNSFGALEGPRAVLHSLGRHVANLHVKDFRVRRASHMMGFTIEGCPAGEGQLNIPWLLGILSELGRDPNAILELWPPPEASPEETIHKEKVWVERSVKFLSSLIPL